MKTGGIPYVAVMNRTDEKIDQYLEGIYNTVIVKDIEQRQARREKERGKRKITDIALLKTIARYLSWERYFTHVLEEHTRGFRRVYGRITTAVGSSGCGIIKTWGACREQAESKLDRFNP